MTASARILVSNLNKLLERRSTFSASIIERALGLDSGAFVQTIGSSVRAPSVMLNGSIGPCDVLLVPGASPKKANEVYILLSKAARIPDSDIIGHIEDVFGPAKFSPSQKPKGKAFRIFWEPNESAKYI